MPLIQTGTIGRSTTPPLAARKWTGTVIEWSTWNSSLSARSNAAASPDA